MEIIGRDVALEYNALSDTHCDSIIDVYKENKKHTMLMDKASGDYPNDTNYYDCKISRQNYPNLFNLLTNAVKSLTTQYYASTGIDTPLISKIERFTLMKYAAGGGQFNHHVDGQGPLFSRRLSIIWYLNNVSEGGRLTLPSKLKPLEITPTKGMAIVFPTDWTHNHYVTPTLSNDRYSMLTFLHH